MPESTKIQHRLQMNSRTTRRELEHHTTGNKLGGIHPTTYQFWKGVLDRVLASLILVIISPVLVLITIGIRLDSPGNPIFRQDRIGKDRSTFRVYKFRTMRSNNDESVYKKYIEKYINENAPYKVDEQGQPVYKVINDNRVTRLGAILRKTNLDELPQFINILKGEMSLIGPRPEVAFAVDMYKKRHRRRFAVKPGITGLWQVCGRKNLSFEEMVNLDIEYIERQSLLLDAKILWKTVGIVLNRDGS